ncbi:hypothetical protein QVD17_08882 [Tagetes erecta]|uniref:Uncharacterized protein n=1 Tax=Tagetes erecta TaxID=13708 RepID=A0AAD8NXU6_TARER|nr:hypothetical protein QVD17_08882 [Tagetes erecta]
MVRLSRNFEAEKKTELKQKTSPGELQQSLSKNVGDTEVIKSAETELIKESSLEITKVVNVIDEKEEGQSSYKDVLIKYEHGKNTKVFTDLNEENTHLLWIIQNLKSKNEKLEAKVVEKEDLLHEYRVNQYKSLQADLELAKHQDSEVPASSSDKDQVVPEVNPDVAQTETHIVTRSSSSMSETVTAEGYDLEKAKGRRKLV